MNNYDRIHLGAWQAAQPQDIVFLQADVNYTTIHFANGRKKTIATTMKKLEKRFEGCQSFFRTHKSFIINLHYIKAINCLHSDEFVEMTNDFRVAVSRRRKVAFTQRMKELNN